MSITIDYGPFGFMDSYDPGKYSLGELYLVTTTNYNTCYSLQGRGIGRALSRGVLAFERGCIGPGPAARAIKLATMWLM